MDTYYADANEKMKKYIDENIDMLTYTFKDHNMLDINTEIFIHLRYEKDMRGFDYVEFNKHLRKYRIYHPEYVLIAICSCTIILALLLNIVGYMPSGLSIYASHRESMLDIVLALINTSFIGILFGIVLCIFISWCDKIKVHHIPKIRPVIISNEK